MEELNTNIDKVENLQKRANNNNSAWDNLVKEIVSQNKVLSNKNLEPNKELGQKKDLEENQQDNYNSQSDTLFANFKKKAKDQEKQSTEQKDFMKEVSDKAKSLEEKRDNVRQELDEQISNKIPFFNIESLDKLRDRESLNKLRDIFRLETPEEISKSQKRLMNLEPDTPLSRLSVDFLNKKLDAEAASFKKEIQFKEKKEKEIFEFLEKNLKGKDLEDLKKKRSEWKEGHDDSVRACRAEHKAIKEFANSKLEPASQMMSDLQDENLPDYTAGDD